MSWWNAQATLNANIGKTQPEVKQDMGVGTGSTYIDPNGPIGRAIANAPKPPSNNSSSPAVNLNPLRFSDPGGDNPNNVITQESLPIIQQEQPEVYKAITSQLQQEVSQSVISEDSKYKGTSGDTLNQSSQYYADNNPGAQNYEEYSQDQADQAIVTSEDSSQGNSEESESSVFSDPEYQKLLERVDELEKQAAANNAIESTVSKGTTSSARSYGGLIDSVISSNSLLTGGGSMKIGGQVYGPDGSTYPSVTDAIQAGVYNYTYFPISTGVKQENKPLTRRTISAPTETPTTPTSSILGVNQDG